MTTTYHLGESIDLLSDWVDEHRNEAVAASIAVDVGSETAQPEDSPSTLVGVALVPAERMVLREAPIMSGPLLHIKPYVPLKGLDYKFTRFGERTLVEHHLLCSRMREVKSHRSKHQDRVSCLQQHAIACRGRHVVRKHTQTVRVAAGHHAPRD